MPVIAHALQWCLDFGQEIESVCCLYATAPFVQPSDIRSGLDLLKQIASDRFVFTATEYPSPIQRALRLDPASGEAQMWQPVNFSKRSQDLEPAYHDAGSFIGVVPEHGYKPKIFSKAVRHWFCHVGVYKTSTPKRIGFTPN